MHYRKSIPIITIFFIVLFICIFSIYKVRVKPNANFKRSQIMAEDIIKANEVKVYPCNNEFTKLHFSTLPNGWSCESNIKDTNLDVAYLIKDDIELTITPYNNTPYCTIPPEMPQSTCAITDYYTSSTTILKLYSYTSELGVTSERIVGEALNGEVGVAIQKARNTSKFEIPNITDASKEEIATILNSLKIQ